MENDTTRREPLSDERLAEVKESIGAYHNAMRHIDLHAAYLIADHVLHDYGDALVIEIERLRAQAAEAREAALDEVQAFVVAHAFDTTVGRKIDEFITGLLDANRE